MNLLPRRKPLQVLVVLAVLGVVGLVLGPLPSWIAPDIAGSDAGEKLDAVVNTRNSLVQLVGGLAVISGLVFTAGSYRLSQRGQITDRFSEAVEHLSDPSPIVRMGGIYALDKVAKDAADYRQIVRDVLTAFVRNRTTQAPQVSIVEESTQTALTVLCGADLREGRRLLDLSGLNLKMVSLQKAHLEGARLKKTNLTSAVLVDAFMQRADLEEAILIDANLSAADLRSANLVGAVLTNVTWFNAKMNKARLSASDSVTLQSLSDDQRAAIVLEP